MILVSIDPGKHKSGFAIFENDELVACGLVKTQSNDLRKEWAGKAWAWPELGVVEAPRVYDRRRWKGDPNDLIDIAIAGGFVLGGVHPKQLKVIRSEDWKGRTPKKIQAKRTLAKLSLQERKLVPPDHNVVDAVGIGLWELRR